MNYFIILTILPILFFVKPKIALFVQTISSLLLVVLSLIYLVNQEYSSAVLFHSAFTYVHFLVKLVQLILEVCILKIK